MKKVPKRLWDDYEPKGRGFESLQPYQDKLTGHQGVVCQLLSNKFTKSSSHSDSRHYGFHFAKGVISMSIVQQSESIRAGLRKGFQDGTSKMARRKCYGYDTDLDGKLVINPDEAAIVRWIFDQYLSGNSLGSIAADLEKKGILSPTRKPKWNREALNKLLSNEKYTGRVLLQKTVSTGTTQIKNDGLMDRYFYTGSHEAIIPDEIFIAVQQEKLSRSKSPENAIAISEFSDN